MKKQRQGPANAGLNSLPLILHFHHVSASLQGSGIKPDTSYTCGVAVCRSGILISREVAVLSPHEDRIPLNLVCHEDHGRARLKILIDSRGLSTITKLLNELIDDDTTTGTENKDSVKREGRVTTSCFADLARMARIFGSSDASRILSVVVGLVRSLKIIKRIGR